VVKPFEILARAPLAPVRPASGKAGVSARPSEAKPLPRRDGSPEGASPLGNDSYTPDPSRQAPPTDAAPKAGKTGDSLMGKVGDKLADTAFYKDYGYRPPSLQFSQFGGVGFDMRVKPIKNSDGLIKNDPNRQRMTERIQQSGKGVTWAELRGAINPWVGVPFWTPVGPVNLSVGFSASASLGLSVLSPYVHNVGEAAKNLSVKLPFDADTARDLGEGTEVTLRGVGRLAVGAGARVGDTWVPLRGPWSIGTSFGTDAYVSKEADLSVRVKRLDGQKVFVSIARVDTDAKGIAVGARAGVHGNLNDVVPDTDNKYVDKGKNFVAKKITREIEKWLSLEVRDVLSTSEAEKELKNYVLDLSKPEAARAYEALMTLDTRPADTLDKLGPDSGVEAVWLTEHSEATANELRARFGGIDLLKSTSRAEVAQGRLFNREGVLHYDRAQLDNTYQDIVTRWWKGKRETQRQFIAQRANDGPTRLNLRMRNETKVDWSTPTADIRRFVTLAKTLGVTTPDPEKLLADEKFLSSYGRSKRIVDFALNDKGIDRLLSASDDDLHKAFAAGYEELDRPWEQTHLFWFETDTAWRTTPWLAKDHPEHATVIRLLEAGPEHSRSNDHGQTRDQEYYWLTGRTLWEDAAAYDESRRLVDLVGKLRRAPTPADRARLLKDESGNLGVDAIREFAMYARIAGRDGFKIGEITLKDEEKKKTLSFTNDGAFQDPRSIVDGWLANPDTGPAK